MAEAPRARLTSRALRGARRAAPVRAERRKDDVAELDIDFVRAQFPAFAGPGLAGQAFFENAGGSCAVHR